MKGVLIFVDDGRVPVNQLEAELGQHGGRITRDNTLG
jgi:hypothetical protein